MTPATKSFDVLAAYRQVRERVANAEAAAGRPLGSVTIVGAAKAQPVERVRALIDAGLTDIGENYWQDTPDHLAADASRRAQWHFIGPIQSNKTAQIAEQFDWVQSLDRDKIARRLDEQRPEGSTPLNVLIQVNISAQNSKAGVAPDEIESLADLVMARSRLQLRGLMAIPAPGDHGAHARLNKIFRTLQARLPDFATLSIGMSADLELAIDAGATMVRIGTALFGPRL